MKKFMSALLSTFLCLSTFAVPVFAVDDGDETETAEEIKESSEDVSEEIPEPSTENTELSIEPLETEPVKETVTVIFDKNADDAIGAMDPQEFIIGKSQKLKSNSYIKDGYDFVCWKLSRDGTSDVYFDEQEVSFYSLDTDEIILYAQWEKERFSEGVSFFCGDYWCAENNDGTIKLKAYNGTDKEVVIPSSLDGKTVTIIDNKAFAGKTSIESITIPNTVESIGDYAFINCTSLRSVILPENLVTLQLGLFKNCSSLSEIIIPESITSIESYVFEDCAALTHITIPKNAVSFNGYPFNGCPNLKTAGPIGSDSNIELGWTDSIPESSFIWGDNLKKVIIPDGVKSIGHHAFTSCSSLTDVVLPNSITRIEDYAFSKCVELIRINIPDGVNYIGEDAFSECGNLLEINIPRSLTKIDYGVFSKCTSLKSVTIPDGVQTVSAGSFYGCINLTKIIIPASVTEINSPFRGCTKLESAGPIGSGADIEFGWTDTIPGYAFSGTDNLKNVIIPDGVTCIGEGLLQDCDELISVKIPGSVVKMGVGVFGLDDHNHLLSAGPLGSGANIEFGWTEMIPDHAFVGSCLTSVEIPYGISTIGESAFSQCDDLISVKIPESVLVIGEFAFSGCKFKTAGPLGSGSDYEFGWKTILVENAFNGFSYLTNVIFPDELQIIGDGAFSDCKSLTNITLPEGVTSIGDYAFYNCEGITSFIIPNSVKTIGKSAFSYCSGLDSIRIPDSVTEIGDHAFSLCKGLTDIVLSNKITNIGKYVFYYCENLSSIEIPGNVEKIDQSGFSYCSSLVSIILPASVKRISINAFSQCDKLESVLFYGTKEQWKSIIIEQGNNSLLDAKIRYLDDEDKYTVTFKLKDEIINTVIVINGGKVTAPEIDFRRKGYTFLNWLDENGNIFDFSAQITKETTIIAEVEPIVFTLTIDLNDGSEQQVTEFTVETPDIEVPIPSRSGYLFLGWTGIGIGVDTLYLNPVFDISDRLKKGRINTRLYSANWAKIENKIYYDEYDDYMEFYHSLNNIASRKPSSEYNSYLVKFTAYLAESVYHESQILKSLRSFGLISRTFGYNVPLYGGGNHAAFAVGVSEDKKEEKLMVIAVRGTNGDFFSLSSEWRSNFYFVDTQQNYGQIYHSGFYKAAREIYETIINYYGTDYFTDENCKIIVTGHSRGAAIANLLEYWITTDYAGEERVYGYNYAVPKTVVYRDLDSFDKEINIHNIFNITNKHDAVGAVPPTLPGDILGSWFDFGTSLLFDDLTGSSYLDGINDRLHAMTSYITNVCLKDFEDYEIGYNTAYNRALIFCPVDIEVFDRDGKLLAKIENNEIVYNNTDSHLILPFVYDDDKKVIIYDPSEQFDIKIKATDNGTMSYYIVGADEEIKGFSDIELKNDKQFLSSIGEQNIGETTLQVVDNNNQVIAQVETDGSESYPENIIGDHIYIKGLRTSYSYTGSVIKPTVQVYDSGKLLTEKTDYTLSYKNNTKAGQATITVTGKGSYTAKKDLNFTIDPVDLNEAFAEKITLVQSAKPKKLTVKPKVTWNGKSLKEKTDYTINYNGWNQTDTGEHEIVLNGVGNFTGHKKVKVYVAETNAAVVPVTKLKITAKAIKYEPNMDLNKVLQLSSFKAEEGKTLLKEGTDYEISEEKGCDRAGTCTFVIEGKGNRYYGKRTVSINISGTAISKAKPNKTAVYDGTGRTLENSGIDLYDGKTKLIEGKDFVVLSYENNINAGKATVNVEGLGAYSGTGKISFTIDPNTKAKTVEVKDAVFAKNGAIPEVMVKNGNTLLKEGTDYKLSYKNNKKVGTGTVTVAYLGNYKGTNPVSKDFGISTKSLKDVFVTAPDLVWSSKAGNFKAKITVADTDGKTLSAGSDYDKNIVYKDESGKELNAKDVVPEGTRVTAIITGTGNYKDSAAVTYTVAHSVLDLSKATIKIANKEYTGSPVEIKEADITATTIKDGKQTKNLTFGTDYKVLYYENNVNKGTAKVTFIGEGNISGTKTVSFKIDQRSVSANWFERLAQALGF